jgi:hypothetical protein
MAVPMLLPGACGDRRQDGEQRRRLGLDLPEAEDDHESRHEQKPAAEPVQAGEHACGETQREREEDFLHQSAR